MKRNNRFVFGMMFFLFVGFFSVYPAQATLYMPVDINGFARVMNAPGAIGFKGKVLTMKDIDRGREYTFQVDEVLKGKVPSQPLVVRFIGPSNVSGPVIASRGLTLPNLYPGYKVVLFLTCGMNNFCSIVGGEGQGLFYIQEVNGKEAIYNSMSNQNIIQPHLGEPLMQSAITQMQKDNTGAFDFENFKKLFNNASTANSK